MAVTRIAILLFVRRERGNVSTSRPESLFFFSPFLRTPCLFFSSSSFSCPCFFATEDVCTYDVYRSILDIISLYLTPTFPPRACGGPIFFGRPAKITVYKRVRNSGVGEGGRKEGREGGISSFFDGRWRVVWDAMSANALTFFSVADSQGTWTVYRTGRVVFLCRCISRRLDDIFLLFFFFRFFPLVPFAT